LTKILGEKVRFFLGKDDEGIGLRVGRMRRVKKGHCHQVNHQKIMLAALARYAQKRVNENAPNTEKEVFFIKKC